MRKRFSFKYTLQSVHHTNLISITNQVSSSEEFKYFSSYVTSITTEKKQRRQTVVRARMDLSSGLIRVYGLACIYFRLHLLDFAFGLWLRKVALVNTCNERLSRCFPIKLFHLHFRCLDFPSVDVMKLGTTLFYLCILRFEACKQVTTRLLNYSLTKLDGVKYLNQRFFFFF